MEINKNFNCRYYSNKYPCVNDIVVVEIYEIDDYGVHVKLVEYNNIKAFLNWDKLHRQKPNIQNNVSLKIGKKDFMKVLLIDDIKGYIDVGKLNINELEKKKLEDKYNKAKQVDNILKIVSLATDTHLLDLYETIAWPLNDQFGSAYDGFQKLLFEGDHLLIHMGISEKIYKVLLSSLKRLYQIPNTPNTNITLSNNPCQIMAEFRVMCYQHSSVISFYNVLSQCLEKCPSKVIINLQIQPMSNYTIYILNTYCYKGIQIVTEILSKLS